MFAIITLPSVNDMFTGLEAWSSGMFTSFQPVMFAVVGIIVGGMLIRFFVEIALIGFALFLEMKRERQSWSSGGSGNFAGGDNSRYERYTIEYLDK